MDGGILYSIGELARRRERTLGEVAAEHVAALDVQISNLRLRRAVLTVAARREPTPEEMELLHHLATLSEAERRRLIEDFLDTVFGGSPHHAAIRRTMTPELPNSPTEEQVKAWVELAELSRDPAFRACVRRLAEDHAARLPEGGPTPPRPDVVAIARDLVGAAIASGVTSESPQADPIVAALIARCARVPGRPADDQLRPWLLRRLETANDPRRDRYFQLLALINGWPAPERLHR